MGKPRARVFGQVLADIIKKGNQTRKTVREKMLALNAFASSVKLYRCLQHKQ
jgi:hypothetical protein